MLVVLFFFVFLGIPVVYSVLGASTIVLLSLRGLEGFSFAMIAQRMLYGINNFTLLAIPTFILMGKLMNSSGITDRIFGVARVFFGHFKGGLGHVNVVASMIFAGMSGSAVADAGGLGVVEFQAMKDDGYPEGFSAAVTAASATIGPIIPPSIPVVIYGSLAGVSIGSLFIGAIIPGILMGLGMMVTIFIIAEKEKFPVSEKSNFRERLIAIKKGFLPLLTPLILIGGIFSGVFTPTEAASVALFYALILSVFVYKSIKISEFIEITKETLIDSSVLLFIISGCSVYSWILARFQLTDGLITFVSTYIDSVFVFLLIINIFLLIMGCFIDVVPALFLLTPILVPLASSFHIHPIHFGILMIFNLNIGLITPPVGTVLYATNKVTNVPFIKIVKEIWPFYISLFIILILITYIPKIVLFLPKIVLW